MVPVSALLAKEAKDAEALAAEMDHPAGSRLILLPTEVPANEAVPAMVKVRPFRLVKEEVVPLVMVKLPELVVVISLPLKSKIPALCAKLRQERLLVAN